MFQTNPSVLTSPYATPTANQPIALYAGPMELRLPQSGGGTVVATGNGEVAFSWLPKPEVTFKFQGPFSGFPPQSYEYDLHLTNKNATVSVLANRVSGNLQSIEVMGLIPSYETVNPPLFNELRFHLVNFTNYYGHFISGIDSQGNPRDYAGRMVLKLQKWEITIDEVCDYQGQTGLKESLHAQGGYAITHIARAKRCNEANFSAQDAEKLLQAFQQFASFMCGYWTAPILPVGYDLAGNAVWEAWSAPFLSPSGHHLSWFDDRHYSETDLSDLLDEFLRLLRNQQWQDVIPGVIYWYLHSNLTNNPDTSTVHSQIAFELLSWVILVQQTKVISEASYEKFSAEDKIRIMLYNADIPQDIPTPLSGLHGYCTGRSLTGPSITTQIRNKTIHPTFRNRGSLAQITVSVRWEASQLALWYLELILLHMLKYKGKYNNRLLHQPETVPWQQ